MKRLLTAMLVILAAASCSDRNFITNLRTEYMTEPLGIDVAQPRFSWEMDSERYGAAQKAYQLTVSEEGSTVFDTGRIESDISVGIPYAGSPLKPRTRYEWKVCVWDERGDRHFAESSFETGLMDEGFGDASWIGSGQPHFSRYRTRYDIDYSVDLAPGSSHGVFVFGWKDEDNYAKADYCLEYNLPVIVLSHVTDGVEKRDGACRVFNVQRKDFEARHDIRLEVIGLDYAKGYSVRLFVDGRLLQYNPVTIQPYPLDVWKPYCRFNSIGFFQPAGDDAEFEGFTIRENTWNTVLYDRRETYSEKGEGKMHILCPADESGAPMLRKSFDLGERTVKSARLYATARGIYEFYINGERVDTGWYNPGSTDYRYRIFYNSFDVTPYLNSGRNAVAAQLGSGWYSDFTGFASAWQDQFGTELSLLGKLVVTFADGTSEVIVTDGSWKVFNEGPVTSDGLQNGEDYDARREVEGWTSAEFDDSAWTPAIEVAAPSEDVEIQYYIGSPVTCQMVLTAQSVAEPKPGVFVYDMGQNMVGVPQVTLSGEAGRLVTFRYGEMIYPNEVPEDPMPPLTAEVYAERKGLAYTENYRGALSTDHYICKGEGSEVFQPHFTFHGYRYIEIHGLEKALPLDAVKGLVMNSVGAQTSGFETSDANINKLYSNIVWGQRGNFLSIPTDCPQRDERMGWTGDAQIFARTATYNMNVDPFFSRWFQSVRDIQGEDGSYCDYIPKVGVPPTGSSKGGGALGWMEAGVVIPWQIYQQYGDTRFVEEHFASMEAYMDYLGNRAVGFIQPGCGYGDWVAVEHTNSPLTNTAYYAYDAILMQKMARAIGKEAEAEKYAALYNSIKDAFNREFVDENGRTKESKNVPPYVEWIAGGSDDKFKANTQTSYVLPLYADLFKDEYKPLAVKYLVEDVEAHGNTLTTGFIGTPYITLVLSDNGRPDVAYRLFEQTAYPSWLYPVLQGATTMWERWNSYTIRRGFGMVDMNSFNHYAFGAIQEWMMSYIIGIQRDEDSPGYHRFILQPRPGGTLEYAKGHYDTVYGRIESGWQKIDGGVRYEFTVPANTEARLSLEIPEGASVSFITGADYAVESGSGVTLPSGKYAVEVK